VLPNPPSDHDRNSAPTSAPKARSRLKRAAQFVTATIIGVAVLVGVEIYVFTLQGLTFSEALGRVAQPTLSDSATE
jgi:hypothetical protein